MKKLNTNKAQTYRLPQMSIIQKKKSKKWLWKDGMEGILFFLC